MFGNPKHNEMERKLMKWGVISNASCLSPLCTLNTWDFFSTSIPLVVHSIECRNLVGATSMALSNVLFGNASKLKRIVARGRLSSLLFQIWFIEFR